MGFLNSESRYNTGRSWHSDRTQHNKSEDWEKPMNQRKQRYAEGGGLDTIEFYELDNILGLVYDGDETDYRLHGDEMLNWGAKTEPEYKEAEAAIDAISYKGNGWEVYAWCDVSGFNYWMNQQEEQNYINITVMFSDDTVDLSEIPLIKKAVQSAYEDANLIAEKYDYVPNSEYKKGGSVKSHYNTGRSWHSDRTQHNKSEDWEKPMNKRKQRYDIGGDLKDYKPYRISVLDENGREDYEYFENEVEAYNRFIEHKSKLHDVAMEKLEGDEYETVTSYSSDEDEFKKGGSVESRYNTGRSWHSDRRQYNKSEDWEKPMNERVSANRSVSKGSVAKSQSTKGKSKNYMYIPNYMIRGAEVNNSGKTTDIDGANILDGIYVKAGTKYGNGGNVGRDWMFKSKQKWEQDYDRKREWKEYKKEGWFANWFKDGGEANSGYTPMGGVGETKENWNNASYDEKLEWLKTRTELYPEKGDIFDTADVYARTQYHLLPNNVHIAITQSQKFAKGGRVKNYKYVPNYMIESVDVERNGKTTEIDGGNILDGLYVKNVKFEEGGYIERIPTETLEAMVGRKLNGWNDDVVIYNGVAYKKCFMQPYYKIA